MEETLPSPTVASAHPDEMTVLLLEAALDLLSKGGRSDFSLRAVADSVGAAGSAASHRFKDRAGLLAGMCRAAIVHEEREAERFVTGLPVVPAHKQLAEVLLAWLEHRVRWARRQTRVCCELLMMSHREAAAEMFGPAWLNSCKTMLSRICPELTDVARGPLALYLLAETPNWLLSADDTLFRLTSAEALRRAVILAINKDASPLPIFWLEQSLLREGETPVAAANFSGTKHRIVEAIANIIGEGGAEAVTHREIAKRAGVALSSLTHHFGNRSELVRTGMAHIARQGAAGGPTFPFELTLEALRDPFLAPLASMMRRQQGAALHRTLNYAGGLEGRARAELASLVRGTAVLAGTDELAAS